MVCSPGRSPGWCLVRDFYEDLVDPVDSVSRSASDLCRALLEGRVVLAAEIKAPKILICFHHNASMSHNANGWEVWTSRYKNNSDDLAEYVWFEHFLLKRVYIGLRMRGDVTDGDHDFEANFREIAAFAGPAIYIENGFFDFKEDLDRVLDPKYINLASKAIVNGVVKFVNK
jgi:N-acetylmuramoyl-L-alanine amidase